MHGAGCALHGIPDAMGRWRRAPSPPCMENPGGISKGLRGITLALVKGDENHQTLTTPPSEEPFNFREDRLDPALVDRHSRADPPRALPPPWVYLKNVVHDGRGRKKAPGCIVRPGAFSFGVSRNFFWIRRGPDPPAHLRWLRGFRRCVSGCGRSAHPPDLRRR